jgi:hypothetical protein
MNCNLPLVTLVRRLASGDTASHDIPASQVLFELGNTLDGEVIGAWILWETPEGAMVNARDWSLYG